MTRIVSTGAKIKQLEGLLGTPDLNEWESKFVRGLVDRQADLAGTRPLTERQLVSLDQLWGRHFA